MVNVVNIVNNIYGLGGIVLVKETWEIKVVELWCWKVHERKCVEDAGDHELKQIH
jgi:hypothetical protein